MIMSFEMFRKVGQAAGILQDALQLPDVTLKDYSRKPIQIFEVIVLEFEWQGNKTTASVYLRPHQGLESGACLLYKNVVITLALWFLDCM